MESIIRAGESGLVRSWWSFVLRGLAAIIFGILAFVVPGPTLGFLIVLFAIYALVEGVFGVAGAIKEIRSEGRSLLLLVNGLVSIAAGIIALAAPRLTAVALLYVIAFWAFVTGAIELVTAIRLRREVEGEWVMGLAGLLSILFGILLVMAPRVGALVMVFQIGFYAIVFGCALVGVGYRLRHWQTQLGSRRRQTPPLSGGRSES
ncbi:putative membrane protein [Labilithrix luteola]|uniref:Putative membrane protein n=1 Tax=Labilithrix luteola TaxID=1391654 RepID=A0A0K1PU39_9BACT|nr:HdeD family acid-resistance protein [Labilithrix luteola]AKU97050.1 putative membrane protein [Labilithrix luteola]